MVEETVRLISSRRKVCGCVVVTDLATPELKSTLTVVVVEARAGAIFGTTIARWRVSRPLLNALVIGGASLTRRLLSVALLLAVDPNNFARGFIHEEPLAACLSLSAAFAGSRAISLILGARDGSRITSLRVTRMCPISSKHSLKSLKRPLKSFRLQLVGILSSSR